jgi:carbamoyltransferase
MAADIILGINAYHADSAACIVRDGQLVAAAEEERFRRIKHWAGFPSEAINYCLREAKINLSDVAVAAVNRNNRANFFRKLSYIAFQRPSPRFLLKRLKNRQQVARISDELHALPGPTFSGPIEHVEHHRAHLASAFLPHLLTKQSLPRSTASAILPARPGVTGAVIRCRWMGGCFSRIPSASSIKR